MNKFVNTAVCSFAMLAAGSALAQQNDPMQPLIEGVPAMMSPMQASGSETTRAEVRSEARTANSVGEADQGGLVAASLGDHSDTGQPGGGMSRAQVQAQVLGRTDRVGGEVGDFRRSMTM